MTALISTLTANGLKRGWFFLLWFLGTAANAADALPEFRGIRLGSAMTPAQIMHALGADTFKVDPVINIWAPERKGEVEKHGMTYMVEQVEFEIGPYCKNEGPKKFHCNNPYMLNVFGAGRDHGIRGTQVFVENGLVHSIDVTFDSLEEDQFMEAIFDKYGKTGWRIEKDPSMVITNLADRSHVQVERITRTKKARDYTIWTTNYDEVFTHPANPYQGIMEIKLVDRNF